jgi:hypothetical protein
MYIKAFAQAGDGGLSVVRLRISFTTDIMKEMGEVSP